MAATGYVRETRSPGRGPAERTREAAVKRGSAICLCIRSDHEQTYMTVRTLRYRRLHSQLLQQSITMAGAAATKSEPATPHAVPTTWLVQEEYMLNHAAIQSSASHLT